MSRRHAAAQILLGFLIAAAAAHAAENWQQLSPATSPAAREASWMTYDAARQQVVLFGGVGATSYLGDTWIWDGSNWTQKTPAASPPARFRHCMAYDTANQVVILFGGEGSTGQLTDTWIWDGTNWTLKSSSGPSGGCNYALAYDQLHQQAIFFGENTDPNSIVGETWAWNGTSWSQLTPTTNPPSTGNSLLVYDEARQQLLLATYSDNPNNNDRVSTWAWDGSNWNRKTDVGTALPYQPIINPSQAVYDALHQQVVVFLEKGAAQTWTWDGTQWQKLSPGDSPSPRILPAMEYDGLHQQVVLFGGSVNDAPFVAADTWRFGDPFPAVNVTVPAGVQFTFDGVAYTGSQSILIAAGSYTLATTLAQAGTTGSQSVFESWSDGGSQSHTVTVGTADVNISGTFQTQYLLTTAASPSNGGTLTPAAPGAYYDAGTQPTLSAAPASGYSFTGWSGACTGATACNVTMNAPASVTADFALQGTQVKINVPAGVSFSFGGTSYTGSQTLQLPSGPYLLTTTSPQSTGAGTQAVFLSWSDGGIQSHSVNVASSALNITGSFQTQYLLTTMASASIGGTVSPPTAYVDQGTLVTVTETPAAGYAFASWSGACAGSGACSVTMNAPAAVTAVFSVIHVAVTINVPPGIQFSLAGLSFTGSRSFSLTEGPYVLSTLSPQSTGTGAQAALVSWSDGGAQSHSVVVGAAAINIAGTFKTQYQLTAAASPAGSGSFSLTPASPGGFYDASTPVVVQATANPGYVFEFFSGACSGSNSFCLVLMTGPQTVGANFTVPLDWVELFPATAPIAREGAAMAWDAAHNNMVLFGGFGNGNDLNDTWVWDGNNWSLRTPLHRPPARASFAMTFDQRNQQVVLFGGFTGAFNVLADTWIWDGSDWTQKSPANGPTPRYGARMVFDPENNAVVLFGGFNADSDSPGTWLWDGNNWTGLAPPSSPSERVSPAMTYDPVRHRLVLFGGSPNASGTAADTWEWDGNNWTQRSPAHQPSGRDGAVMAFDARIQQVVLFDGSDLLNDTWTWNGTDWSHLFPVNSPSARRSAAMDYDPLHQELVLFGGTAGASEQDTWIYLPPSVNVLSQGVSSVKDAGGNILVTVTLTNAGNIPLTDILVLNAKLGNTSAAAFTTPQLVAGVAPGAKVSFTAKFPPTAVGGLLSSAVAFSGSYSAGPTVGAPWTVSIRQSPVP